MVLDAEMVVVSQVVVVYVGVYICVSRYASIIHTMVHDILSMLQVITTASTHEVPT